MRFPEILKFAPIESSRFNLCTYRALLEDINTDQLLSSILEKKIDLLILRVPAKNQRDLAVLNELGIPFIMADTLVYYHADMQTITPRPFHNKDIQFIQFTPDHFDVMDQMVKIIFAGYHNNYTANPILQADLITIYQEWARNYATDLSKGKVSWLIGSNDQFFGLITCLIENGGLEIILNGVMPHKTGQGVYGDMLRFIQTYCIENKLSHITISTQVNNYAVQKVWGREGFYLRQAFLTIHINSLMQTSQKAKRAFDFEISREELRQLSAGKAGSSAKEGSIATTDRLVEDIFWSDLLLAKYHQELIPIDKATIRGVSVRYLKMLQIKKRYRIEISYPYIDRTRARSISLLKIIDRSGTVCLFAYFDFIVKEEI